MTMTTWDWPLFDLLNFNGGAVMDAVMSAVSGVAMWVPLYILIIYMVWRAYSWRGVVVLLLSVGVAMGLADMVAGIFKHSGLLKDVWAEFPARLRPMFTEELSNVHVVSYGHGEFGTVSAHAATIVALALLTSMIVRVKWLRVMMIAVATLVCYSRIYLACHFPQDILLGTLVGLVSGFIGAKLFGFIIRRWS